MTADAILTLCLTVPAILTGLAHAFVWSFYPEAR